jgi:hypothetical protein
LTGWLLLYGLYRLELSLALKLVRELVLGLVLLLLALLMLGLSLTVEQLTWRIPRSAKQDSR